MRYIFKNIKYTLVLFIAFVSTAYLLSEITKIFQKKQIAGLVYKESTISNFVMTGVGEENFILKGKKIIDKKDTIKMFEIYFRYRLIGMPVEISSKYADVLMKKKIVNLKDSLFIKLGSVDIYTDKLTIYMDKKIAKNNDKVLIKSSDKMITTGRNLLIDIKTNTLQLENVKTIIRGS